MSRINRYTHQYPFCCDLIHSLCLPPSRKEQIYKYNLIYLSAIMDFIKQYKIYTRKNSFLCLGLVFSIFSLFLPKKNKSQNNPTENLDQKKKKPTDEEKRHDVRVFKHTLSGTRACAGRFSRGKALRASERQATRHPARVCRVRTEDQEGPES